ncbi:hypothetical protein QQ045_025039 [Rhodiola kirilowii]
MPSAAILSIPFCHLMPTVDGRLSWLLGLRVAVAMVVLGGVVILLGVGLFGVHSWVVDPSAGLYICGWLGGFGPVDCCAGGGCEWPDSLSRWLMRRLGFWVFI